MKPKHLSLIESLILGALVFTLSNQVMAQKKGLELRPMMIQVLLVECYEDDEKPYCYVEFPITENGYARHETTVSFSPCMSSGITDAPKMAAQIDDDHYGEVNVAVPMEIGKVVNENYLASLDLHVLSPGYVGIMTELAEQSIFFTDVEGNGYCDFSRIHKTDCPTWEEWVWKKMAEDIRLTATAMRGKMDEPEIKGNLFGGMKLFDAMEACRTDHVRLFLSYVAMRPDIYRGKPLKISETFATWLIGAAPMPATNAIQALRSAKRDKDEAKFNSLVAEYQVNELRELVRFLVRQAHKQMGEGQKDESLVSLVLAEHLATAASNREHLPRTTDLVPWVALHAGLWELQFGDVQIALDRFKAAKKGSNKWGRELIEVAALCGETQAASKAGNHKKVIKVADKAVSFAHSVSDDSYEEVRDFISYLIGMMYLETAKARMALGESEMAQGACWDALEYAEPLPTIDGYKLQSQIFAFLTKCLSDDEMDAGQVNEYNQKSAEMAKRAEELRAEEEGR